jgi:hypothetical protein
VTGQLAGTIVATLDTGGQITYNRILIHRHGLDVCSILVGADDPILCRLWAKRGRSGGPSGRPR